MRKFRYLTGLLILSCFLLFGCANSTGADSSEQSARSAESIQENEDLKVLADEQADTEQISEDGCYSSKEEVAAYLNTYGHLPDNYITKSEAAELGWESKEGNLDEVALGKSIGGDRFGNREGLLPEKKGRQYYECDIDFEGSYRNGKRIIYSNDGLIYYTEDHYESFELLYGEE